MPIPGGVAPLIAINDHGRSSGGSVATLIDNTKNWPVDMWKGASISLFLGNVLCTKCIISNTSNAITFAAITAAIGPGVQYFILSTNILADGASVIVSGMAEVAIAVQRVPLTVVGVADVTIDAQAVGVYTERDWAATEDNDVSLTGQKIDTLNDWQDIISYTPAGGRVLYIDDFSYHIESNYPLRITVAGVTIWQTGATAGMAVAIPFTTPKKVEAGQALLVQFNGGNLGDTENYANLGCREYAA